MRAPVSTGGGSGSSPAEPPNRLPKASLAHREPGSGHQRGHVRLGDHVLGREDLARDARAGRVTERRELGDPLVNRERRERVAGQRG